MDLYLANLTKPGRILKLTANSGCFELNLSASHRAISITINLVVGEATSKDLRPCFPLNGMIVILYIVTAEMASGGVIGLDGPHAYDSATLTRPTPPTSSVASAVGDYM